MTAFARKLDRPGTLQDLLAIPESERRHELIAGAIVEKGAASAEHGEAQFNLSSLLGPYRKRSGGDGPGGWWFATEVEVQFDEENTFRPDAAGWRRERVPERPRGTPVTVRPNWVCEILSTNRRHDLIRKKRGYHKHDVPHYWIIDPEEQTLAVYRWTRDGYTELACAERGEVVRAEPFEAIALSIGALFGEDDEASDGAP